MKAIAALFLSCLLIWAALTVSGHSGGTDSDGGHYDRRTGDYHYHNPRLYPVFPQSTNSAEIPAVPDKRKHSGMDYFVMGLAWIYGLLVASPFILLGWELLKEAAEKSAKIFSRWSRKLKALNAPVACETPLKDWPSEIVEILNFTLFAIIIVGSFCIVMIALSKL